MKIYTRTGDQGKTSLFTGKRVSKKHPFIEALGAVDEANSAIGMVIAFLPLEKKELKEIKKQLENIQHALFDVGAAIATPRTEASEKKLEKTRFDDESIGTIEKWIDAMQEALPPLTHFILPGGHQSGAALHLSRSLIRRAERDVTSLYDQEDVSKDVLIYLNRLSDYLFMASRYVNHVLNIPETIWEPHRGASHK